MHGEILFISDCHVDPARPEVCAALVEFLDRRAAGAEQLYILGDLFEVWLGDDTPPGALASVIDALQRRCADVETFFLAGNRDFLLGEAFANRIGLRLLDESGLLRLGERRVLLIHGDTLCTDDHDYQAFRELVRGPAWQAEFLAKPLAERKSIAAGLRRDSADAMAQKSSQIMDVNPAAVTACFAASEVDTIVHGHTHRPARHDYPGGLIRYVLGDWNPGPSYLSWTAEQGFNLIDPRV